MPSSVFRPMNGTLIGLQFIESQKSNDIATQKRIL